MLMLQIRLRYRIGVCPPIFGVVPLDFPTTYVGPAYPRAAQPSNEPNPITALTHKNFPSLINPSTLALDYFNLIDFGAAARGRRKKMRAVTGIVRSSKPISLSKASAILSRFAAADIGARSDIAAYLKRASAAFEDLVQVHRELRASRKRLEQGVADEEGEESSRRKKKEKGGDPNPDENLQSKVKLEVLAEEEEEAEAKERRNKKRKKKKEREDGSLEVYDKGNLMDVERNIEERVDLEKNYTELNGKVKVEVEEVEGDRSAERKKKKEEKKKKRDREVVENGGVEIEDGSERREKKRRRRKTEE